MKFKFVLFGLALAILSANASAYEKSQFAIGGWAPNAMFGLSGLSAKLGISEDLQVQTAISFTNNDIGDGINLHAQGNFQLDGNANWRSYGFAGFTLIDEPFFGQDDFALEAGGGVEFNWLGFMQDAPPLFWNIDVGVSAGDGVGLTFGSGVHYYF